MNMNDNFHNVDVSSRIGLINRHALPKFKELRNLNDTNRGVKNSDFSGGH